MKYLNYILQLSFFFLIIPNFLCKKNSSNKKNFKAYKTETKKGNTSFVPLNIYIDLLNFNYTFPNDTLGKNSKNLLIEAMNKAKSILENLLYIEIDYDEKIIIDAEYFRHYGIEFYSKDINNSFLYPYNLYILYKFNSLKNNIASSEIVYGTGYSPIIGVITLDVTKFLSGLLKLNYLTNLIIHQFIHILGFHIPNSEMKGIIKYDKINDVYYIDEKVSPNLFNYAKKYFNCSNITKIVLEKDEENNIHWPSRFFSGELMTFFSYSDEYTLSNFTLSFLESLPFLQLKENLKFINNCDKYIIDDNNINLICKQTLSGYALNHTDNEIILSKKSILENINTNDLGINDYSCSLYNSIKHCLKCSNKNTCIKCRTNYILINDNKTCILNQSIKNNNNLFKNRALNNNNECSKINYCIKCTSNLKCTLCQQGYTLNNNLCKQNENDNSAQNVAVGIVFGIIGLILIIVTIVLCIRKKRAEEENEKKNMEKKEKSELTDIKNEDDKNIVKDINDNVLVIVNRKTKKTRSIKNFKV